MTASIGIIGTAKNTGKTTTASSLLAHYAGSGIRVGLTSIGYDGEDVDNITGLPKPRIIGESGNIVATARVCYESSEAELRTLKETDIETSLGNVIIGEVVRAGRIVLAGPNRGIDVRHVLQYMDDMHARLSFVDGALNRIVPLMETDGIIVATGASRSTSVDYIAGEVSAILEILALPRAGDDFLGADVPDDRDIVLFSEKKGYAGLGFSSLIRDEQVERIIDHLDPAVQWIRIPGLCSLDAFKKLAVHCTSIVWGKRIILRNPSQLLLSADTKAMLDLISLLQKLGILLQVERKIPVLAVTVNPFYPVFQSGADTTYKAGLIDGEELLKKVRSSVHIPVMDIEKEGPGMCIKVINERFGI